MISLHSTYLFFVIISATHAFYASNSCKHPAVNTPDKWVPNENCLSGHTYQDTTNAERYHCACWGHCGYICRKINNPGTTVSTTKNCPFGSPWIPPSNPDKRCVCKRFNNEPYYDCIIVATTTTAAGTTAVGTTVAGTTAVGTTAAGTTAAGTTAAGTTAAGTTAAGTTAAGTTAAGTTAAGTTTAAAG